MKNRESEQFTMADESREDKAERYYQELESLADGAGRMRRFLIENPKPNKKSFEREIINNKEIGLPDRVKEKLKQAFLDYQEKTKIVDYHRKLYKGNPEEFFETMFCFKPQEKVGTVWHPLGVQFFLEKADYKKVISQVIKSFTVRPLKEEGGFYDENLGSGNMRGLVSVSRRDISEEEAGKIYDHELQHTIHHNFFATSKETLKEFYRDLKRQTAEDLLKARSYLEAFRNILGERWRDEVLAYYVSHGQIPSAEECLAIDSQRLIGDIQELIFEEYLKDCDPKYAILISDPEFLPELLEAIYKNNFDNFNDVLLESAQKHKVRTPTEDEMLELFNDVSRWKNKYLMPLFIILERADNNFYQEIRDKKEPLIKNLIARFGTEKAFNLLSVTHFSKLHQLEKLIKRQNE